MVPQALLIALGTLASEDLTCIATGVLVGQGKLSFSTGVLACFAGIVAGDILLFLTGRLFGAGALRWSPLARFLPRAAVERGADWLERKGLGVIFLSRFTPGLRLPTYFAAGLLPTRASKFFLYFLIASAVWTPLLVGAAAILGEGLLEKFFAQQSQTLGAFAAVFAVLAACVHLARRLLTFSGRRRLAGFLKRIARWEFWPPWAAYLPFAPYFLYLATRHRSLTLFTAANPGISSGGFAGESKSRILWHLSRLDGVVPEFTLIPRELDPRRRVREARRFMDLRRLAFPVVLKPDSGERGSGVAVIHADSELEAYVHRADRDTIIQAYAAGVEFGVFYYRFPGEARGRILSITEKHFPEVTGDGRTSLGELILRDSRAVCIARAYERVSKLPLDFVPAAGESIPLVEIGSHCRGAVFLDASHCNTAALESAIDRISRAHPGFFFGRFDLRAPSVEAFQRGHSLQVIELNGVSSEATHIYDPAVSLAEAYRVLFEQWRIAFEIGAANRRLGFRPMSLRAFLTLLLARQEGGPPGPLPAPRPALSTNSSVHT